VASVELSVSDVRDRSIVDVAQQSGLCKSKGEARRLIQNGGLYLNNERVGSVDSTVQPGDIVDGRLLVLRTGKRNFHLVRVVQA